MNFKTAANFSYPLNKTNHINTGELALMLILFILWPFGVFVLSLIRYRMKTSMVFLFLFYTLYGLTFILPADTYDSYRLVSDFMNIVDVPSSEFARILSGYYFDKAKITDAYLPLMFFVVSRISNNYHILYFILSCVYGYFLVKYIALLIKQIPKEKLSLGLHSLLLLILAGIYIRFSAINGIRFWTAVFMFAYFAYSYFLLDKKKYLYYFLIIPFVHIGMSAAVLIVFLHKIIGNRIKYYYFVIFLAFFLSTFFDNFLIQLSGEEIGISENIDNKFNTYTKAEQYQKYSSRYDDASFVLVWYQNLALVFCITSILITRNKKYFIRTQELDRLYSFILLFLSAIALFYNVPHLSQRYNEIFILFCLGYLFLTSLHNSNFEMKVIGYLSVPFCLLALYVGFSSFIPTFDIQIMYNNLISIVIQTLSDNSF